MTNNQKVFGGIGVAIILLLVFVKRVKTAPVLEEEVVVDTSGEQTEKKASGGGFGGGRAGGTDYAAGGLGDVPECAGGSG